MEVTVVGSSITWTDRPMSSYCIDGTILVDCGEGTQKNYKKCGVEFCDIRDIFITHTHGDHSLAIATYLCEYVYYSTPEKLKILTIYGGRGIKKFLTDLYKLVSYPDDIDLEKYVNIVEITDFDRVYQVGKYKVSTFKLLHGEMEDIGYIFDDGKTTVGFSGDCIYNENLEKFVANSQNLFLECCGMKSTPNHIGYDKFKYFMDKYPEKKFFAIHCVNEVFFNADKLGIIAPDTEAKFKF